MVNDIERKKEETISFLKRSIESYINNEFVENYEWWEFRMKMTNSLISKADETIEPYSYNEFCKAVIEATNSFLNTADYDNLFLTGSEYLSIAENNTENFEDAILKELHDKFMINFWMKLISQILRYTLRNKLRNKCLLMEEVINDSIFNAEEITEKIIVNGKL